MDSAREAGGGVSSTVLMRFMWPHGGRSVFVSGSFNRWSQLVPMSPVEGCPKIFQVIYPIPPGYQQYKFLVDGEWRYDEQQPFSQSEYGISNVINFSVEPNCNSTINPETPMELDNEAFRRLVSVSDGALSQGVPSLSESDLQVSRHHISVFLCTHTAYELLPKSGKVVAFDVDTPVKQAFHILYEQGISIAPLWDFSKGQFVGVLSALDFILIFKELGNHGSNLTEEELDTHTIAAWKEGKAYMNRQIGGHMKLISRPLIHAGPYDHLKELASRILQNGVAAVPIIYSSSEDGSFPQLLHLASLSGILKCICRYFKHCSGTLPILQLPICAVPVVTWVPKIGESNRRPFAMLRPSASLSTALNLLIQAQALQLEQNSYSPYELRGQRCQMCLRSDTLHQVMERLANPGVRRLIVVEAGSRRVEGIVTLGDIFKFLLG